MIALAIVLIYIGGFILSIAVGGTLYKREDPFAIAYVSMLWPVTAPIFLLLAGGAELVKYFQRQQNGRRRR